MSWIPIVVDVLSRLATFIAGAVQNSQATEAEVLARLRLALHTADAQIEERLRELAAADEEMRKIVEAGFKQAAKEPSE